MDRRLVLSVRLLHLSHIWNTNTGRNLKILKHKIHSTLLCIYPHNNKVNELTTNIFTYNKIINQIKSKCKHGLILRLKSCLFVFCTFPLNSQANSPYPAFPPERRGPGTPSVWPPRQNSSLGWAGTDRRTRRTWWSSGSTSSSVRSYAADLRKCLSAGRGNIRGLSTLTVCWRWESSSPSPTILLSSLSKCFLHMAAASSAILRKDEIWERERTKCGHM